MNQTRGTDLIGFLEQLRKENNIYIVYEPALVRGLEIDPTILIGIPGIEEKLEALLVPVGLDYQILRENTYAVVKARTNVQDITVSGRVISQEDNLSIPGVTVSVKGTATGVVTDFDGNYSIKLPSPESVLVFSSIGFVTVEQMVGNVTELDIVMKLDTKQLSEVVITATGTESDKRQLGYSIENVDTEDILKSRETNISSALSAKAAGVQVTTSSGSPGASASVRIRGSRSITGGNEPLYVIDGVPVNNSSTGNGIASVDVSNRAIDINPNDIAKITILKGPSATVLYGSRGANGVIMINTKRGKTGAPTVTLTSAYGVSEVNKLPPMQKKYAQGIAQAGEWLYRGPETTEQNSWGPLISELEFDGDTNYPYDNNGRLVPLGAGNGMPANAYDANSTFWVKGVTQDNNVSVIGGTDAVKYYFSAGHFRQTGIVPNTDFSRLSIKSNLDMKISERLSAGVSATYINSGGDRAQRGSNRSGVTVGVFRNTPTFDIGNGLAGREAGNSAITHILPNGEQRSYRGNGNFDNPYWSVNRNPFEDNVNRLIGNINLSYTFSDWLKASYKVGIDQYSDVRKLAWDINSSSEPVGRVDQVSVFSDVINSDLILTAYKTLGDFTIDATIGHNYFYNQRFNRSSEGYGMSVQGFYNISNTQTVLTDESYTVQEKFFGAYTNISFSFRDFLFLGFSGRNDWSSTLPKSNNSFFYPAANVAIDISEPLKLTKSKYLSYAKLRFSYGQVGSATGSFVTDSYYSNASVDGDGLLSANQFPAFGLNAFERGGLLANNALTHELTTTTEIGTEIRTLGGRLGIDFTYYSAITKNQILAAPISAATGYTAITINSGEFENKGIELTMDLQVVEKRDFSWNMNVNFTRNRSMVTSLPNDGINLAEFSAISSVALVGQPFGAFRGTMYSRNEEGRMIIGSDGWPLISPVQDVIGDPNPDWLSGVSNYISYRGFDFSMLWDIRQGGDVWNGTKGAMDYLGTSKESGDLREVKGYVFDGVTQDGQENEVAVDFANPAFGMSGIKWRKAGSLLGLAEDYIEDASWVRLREITLGYTFSEKMFQRNNTFQSINISAYGRNLYLKTDYKGVDPETNLRGTSNALGWDYFNLPNTRSYGLALKVVLK
ncbi:MAG: SusC/RagA family TonB-linked outer membrane protein [Cyclobacteriaceae bacterium]